MTISWKESFFHRPFIIPFSTLLFSDCYDERGGNEQHVTQNTYMHSCLLFFAVFEELIES
jgi:hypothetical protein